MIVEAEREGEECECGEYREHYVGRWQCVSCGTPAREPAAPYRTAAPSTRGPLDLAEKVREACAEAVWVSPSTRAAIRAIDLAPIVAEWLGNQKPPPFSRPRTYTEAEVMTMLMQALGLARVRNEGTARDIAARILATKDGGR